MVKKCVKLVKSVIISDNECLGTCFSEKIIEIGHILAEISPQCGKSRFLEDSTENSILDPRKPLSEDQQGVLLGVAQPNLLLACVILKKQNKQFLTFEKSTPRVKIQEFSEHPFPYYSYPYLHTDIHIHRPVHRVIIIKCVNFANPVFLFLTTDGFLVDKLYLSWTYCHKTGT